MNEFKKALAEFNNQGCEIYREGINEGAWWGYEYINKRPTLMVTPRDTLQARFEELAKIADELAEAAELKITKEYWEQVTKPQLKDAHEFNNYLITNHCYGQKTAYEHCWSALAPALEKYRKFRSGK